MRKVLLAALVVIMFLMPPYLRARREAGRHLALARGLMTGDIRQSLASYRRAVSWYAPFSPASSAALLELRKLAEDPKLPPELRADAWQELYSGLQSSRNFIEPWLNPERRQTAAEALEMLAKLSGAAAGKAEGGIEIVHPPRLIFGYQLMAQLFFWGWIAAVLAAIWKGFTPQGAVINRPLLCALAAAALCYALWLTALSLA